MDQKDFNTFNLDKRIFNSCMNYEYFTNIIADGTFTFNTYVYQIFDEYQFIQTASNDT